MEAMVVKSTRSGKRLMTCRTVRRSCGNKDLKYNGWVLGIAIQNTSIQRPLGEKKKNTITRLMDERGAWKESTLGVAEVAISYFEKLYTKSQPNRI